MSSNNSIISRTHRLNKLIVCCSEHSNSDNQPNIILNRETLLDAFNVLYNECNKDAMKKSDRNILDFAKKYQNIMNETKKQRVNIDDFNIKDLIGKGFFGEVHLAIEKATHDVYAIKKVPKVSFTQSKVERNIMATSRSDWIPKLQYAFQDQTHLYLVMEYLPGGDLFSLMVRNNTFPEDVVQFYLAEITLGLNALHSLGYVHRDIKPENILLDRLGHLKLADFGSAISMEKDGFVTSYTPAGTPDYIAPELLQPIHSKKPMKTMYNETCDFWSMGIIAYEMLTETTPWRLRSHNVHETYSQILSYVDDNNIKKLPYPKDIEISEDLRDLIERLITKVQNRLSYNKIITHKFFQTIDWMNLRQIVPPIIPTLNGEDDTSNFEEDLKKLRRNNTFDASFTCSSKNGNFSGFDLPFVGFGYIKDEESEDGMSSTETNLIQISRLTTRVKSLQKTIDTQMLDISSLQKNLSEYQKKSAQAISVEKILGITKEEMNALKEKLKEKTVEIACCRTQIKTLKNSLKVEEEQRVKNDANIAGVLNSTYQKWERVKKQSEQNYEKQISEKKSEVLAIQSKLKLCERELESKAIECIHLQETIDSLMERLKSSKCQSDTEKTAYARKHRDSNVYFEGQLRDLRAKLQTQMDEKHKADDENQRLKGIIEESKHKLKLMTDHNDKLNQSNVKLTQQLNKEIEENRNLREENHNLIQTNMDLKNKFDHVTDSNEGTASLYCSLESISSEVETQLKRDLEAAKEGENEQRLRANSLEETVRRLEAVIERVGKQGISGVEIMLERKNEKLEEKLNTVQEQATIEKQASRTAHLQLWKSEKELDTIKNEKQRLEQDVKKLQNEIDDLNRRVKENKLTAQNRDERIKELQNDLTTRKNELQIERSRWAVVEKERNKEKIQIVNQNTKIHKMEFDLNEFKSKMTLFEQQKNALTIENQQLTQKLRTKSDKLDETIGKLAECQQNFGTINKNYEVLKSVCSLMETQLTELEEMYNAQLEQNKEKSVSIDKLWDDIRDRDAKLLKLQQENSDQKSRLVNIKQVSSEFSNQLAEMKRIVDEHQKTIQSLQEELSEKTKNLIKSEELVELQKNEVQSLQCMNRSLDREIIIVKEENSKLLTELYISKENHQKLQFEYSTLFESYNDLRKELDQLNGTMTELNKYHIQREIKSEATQAQYKKLIDYLTIRVSELTQKKKKTIAEVLFGSSNNSSKKENIPPISSHVQKEDDIGHLRFNQKSHRTKMNTFSNNTTEINEEKSNTPSEKRSNNLEEKKIISSNSDSSETHLFERASYSNSLNMPEKCDVCKNCFKNDTIYQCNKCNIVLHQFCRGGNLKCITSETSDSENEKKSLQLEYVSEVILKENDFDPALEIFCLHEIEENILIMGCASGLKAFNINNQAITHVANIDYVINMAIIPMFPKSILISENGKRLLQCDLMHLQTRANASVCLNTGMDCIELNLLFSRDSDLWRFIRIFDNTDRDQNILETTAIAATYTQIVILRYDFENQYFKAISSLDTAAPIQSIHFTPFTAIVSSDKFFEIDLNTLISEEFLDTSDASLSNTYNACPLNAFAVNTQEYLMCFKDFGVFVNEFGCRTRSNDLKWSKKQAKAFAYRAPVLYVFSEDGIQLIHIHESDADGPKIGQFISQTFINVKNAAFGSNFNKFGVYILSSAKLEGIKSSHKQILRIDSAKAINDKNIG